MKTQERLGSTDLVAVVTAYRDALRSHEEALNRLNVYPVPDGDTGTNMALTLESVLTELAAHDTADLDAVTRALAHGSLMGARGNSGVILAQILRGIASVVGETAGIDAAVAIRALRRAADDAYGAVGNPVEGTILSVARAAAEGAEAAGTDGGLVEVLDSARRAAADALARTTEQLEALRAAGVVDAGGGGLVLLIDAFLHVADGRPLPPPPPVGPDEGPAGSARPADAGEEADATDSGGELRYEVMYLLEAPDDTIPEFRRVWGGVGDSIVVVGGDGTWNCHIHTNDIGAAVEAALDAGRPRSIRVTDLWDQVEEERWVREATVEAQPPPAAAPVTSAVVAVCTGEGIRRIFHSLGVSQTIAGGQSMNPSTRQLADAIEAAPAEQVVILPNNRNIVAVAEQAAALSAKAVRVVPTPGMPEGFAALLDYDPEAGVDANVTSMEAATGRVVAGEITRAVRDSTSDVGPISEGDYLGLSRRGIEAVAPTIAEAAFGLLDRLIDADHHEIVTIIAGEGATAAETRAVTEWLAERHPDVAAEVHEGDQPLYPYLFSIESARKKMGGNAILGWRRAVAPCRSRGDRPIRDADTNDTDLIAAPASRAPRRRARRRRPVLIGAALLAGGLAAAACGSSASHASTPTTSPTTAGSSTPASSTSGSSTSGAGTVRDTNVPGVGSVLVDATGHTLYLLSGDHQQQSTCLAMAGCAAVWPPLELGAGQSAPVAGPGVQQSLLSTVKGPDGKAQVTYNHWPLYTFAGDSGPAQDKGQGIQSFGGVWSAVTSSGQAAKAAPAASPSTSSGSTSSSSRGGGGY